MPKKYYDSELLRLLSRESGITVVNLQSKITRLARDVGVDLKKLHGVS